MFENPRRGRQARNFTTNAPKILDLKLSSEQIFSRKLPLGAPELSVNKKCGESTAHRGQTKRHMHAYFHFKSNHSERLCYTCLCFPLDVLAAESLLV